MSNTPLIVTPNINLPDGLIFAPFRISRFPASRGLRGFQSVPDATPWTDISYREAAQACMEPGFNLLTERQAHALMCDIGGLDINWTGGCVGQGRLFQLGDGRDWHQLSNGEKIHDLATTLTWLFDDIHGNEAGLTDKTAANIISLFPQLYPSRGIVRDMATLARKRLWFQEYGLKLQAFSSYPDFRYINVGFRYTQPIR